MAVFASDLTDLIDFDKKSLTSAALAILFNPIFWNIVARCEYHSKILTRLDGGNSRRACYKLGFLIFSLGIMRDLLFAQAILEQPTSPFLLGSLCRILSYCLLAAGNTLVISSIWALGFTGTYLGDYFGILMDNIVTGFPFNITNSPMYYGSTINFIGGSIYYGKPAGLLLSLEVFIIYLIALKFEDPFTKEIYAKREREINKELGKKEL